MDDAVGPILLQAMAVAISPTVFSAAMLLWAVPRARVNAAALMAGWVLTVAAVTGVVVLLAGTGDGARHDGGPAGWVHGVKAVLGVALLLLAAREWRLRPTSEEPTRTPRVLTELDQLTPGGSAMAGAGQAVTDPKNLVLLVGAALTVAASPADAGGQTVAVVVFTAIASLCVTVPGVFHLLGAPRPVAAAEDLRAWTERNQTAVTVLVMVLMGVSYLGEAIGGQP